jgi:hypothetical protein
MLMSLEGIAREEPF